QAIFQLCGNRVTVEIASCNITPQFAVCSVDAVSVERRLSSRKAGKAIVCKDLLLRYAPVFVEGEFVALKRVFATQALREEVRRKVHQDSGSRIEDRKSTRLNSSH